jgi:hypothetical protein
LQVLGASLTYRSMTMSPLDVSSSTAMPGTLHPDVYALYQRPRLTAQAVVVWAGQRGWIRAAGCRRGAANRGAGEGSDGSRAAPWAGIWRAPSAQKPKRWWLNRAVAWIRSMQSQ